MGSNCYSEKTDNQLAFEAGQGDELAYAELYHRHNARTKALCLRTVGSGVNSNNIDDLNQEIWLQVYRKIGSFRGDSKFTTWLHRLSINQILMNLRKKSVKNELLTENGEFSDQIILEISSAVDAELTLQQQMLIEKAANQLPRGYYMAWFLHDIKGMSHEEIAQMLGCSLGTSKSQLHKARKKLAGLVNKKSFLGHTNGDQPANQNINNDCPWPNCPLCLPKAKTTHQ